MTSPLRNAVRRLAAVTIALCALAMPQAQAQSEAVSAASFLERIRQAQQVLDSEEHSLSAQTFDRMLRTLDLPVTVTTRAGNVAIPQDPQLEALTSIDEGLQTSLTIARVRLSLLAAEVTTAEQRDGVDQTKVRESLGGAYRGIDDRPSVLQRIRRWIAERFTDFVGALLKPRGTTSVIAWVVVIAGAVALAVVFARSGAGPRRAQRHREQIERPEAADWRALAEEALARGDVAAAVRYEYVFLLDTLADRELIPANDSVTAGECKHAVRRSAPSIAASVAQACLAFERAAYASERIDVSAVHAVRSATAEAQSFHGKAAA